MKKKTTIVRNRVLASAWAGEVYFVPKAEDLGDNAYRVAEIEPPDDAWLEKLGNAIDDHLGWRTKEDEEGGDYPARVIQVAEELRAKNGRIDALRIAIAKHRDILFNALASGTHEAIPARALRAQLRELDEAIAADEAAAGGGAPPLDEYPDPVTGEPIVRASGGVVAESATSGDAGTGETKECPECGGDGANRDPRGGLSCAACNGLGRIQKGEG